MGSPISLTRKSHRRRGAALIEFAVCLPVILLLVLASIETCQAIFTRQALAVSAYEAVRVAIRKDSLDVDANTLQRAQRVLADRDIRDATVVFDPPQLSSAERGDYVTVTVSAPFARALFSGSLLRGRLITSSATMVKE